MTPYEKYQQLQMDLSLIGLENGNSNSDYFCTPKGAEVIGWVGVDGIHYCFIKDFGETVFAVSPMNLPGDYVHPIARNFEDFLRLILSCGDTSAIEQAHGWDQATTFDDFLKSNQPTPEQLAVLDKLIETFRLSPMDQPFKYIKETQSKFDYSKIEFKSDYYDYIAEEPQKETAVPKWKVYYDGSYRYHHSRKAAGKETVINKKFTWGENNWYVPAVYTCTEGLVIDICVEVDPERIKAFIDKYKPEIYHENCLSVEESQQLCQENPLSIDYNISLKINRKNLPQHHGSSMSWIPKTCLVDGEKNLPETKLILRHYGLDPSRGWYFSRQSFLWATVHKPVIKSLVMKLEQNPLSIPGIHFNSTPTGKNITFMHPVTGTEHTLTVLNYEKQEIQQPQFKDKTYEYPTHYGVMTYTLSPDILREEISVIDCCEGDCPRYGKTDSETIEDASFAASYGIIGGACGPVAILVSDTTDDNRHIACSSMHFTPVEDVEWRIGFYHKTLDDKEVCLIDS